MKNIDWDKMWIGIAVGLIAPLLALTGYYLINYSYMTLGKFIFFLKLGDTHH